VPVNGDGTYKTSTGYTAAAAGTYQWTAAYSGDAKNSPAAISVGVAVNPSNLFWANQSDGTIWAANIDRTNPHPLVNIPPGKARAGSLSAHSEQRLGSTPAGPLVMHDRSLTHQ
jgi:hypothetical protein